MGIPRGQIRSVRFRGEKIDVEVIRDGGYERDTNAHELDWEIFGMDARGYAALKITEDEEEAIYQQLIQMSHEEQD